MAYEPARARIERELRESIARGDFIDGEQLPSARDLAVRHKVSISTVQAALNALKDAGVVEGRQGVGYFVGASSAPADRLSALEARVAELERWRAEHDGGPGQ